ncbi:glycosyltransferase family protein [Pseudosulfitobacter koreensis]|uniref:Capsule polysaccharide biosynthesis protein n=1 Tax=Pseudosulfitobacter koreensis TaxID=2968472 RepID=A0ABT1YX39_9RHOB|nr:hypothetical protein [Pseudosulfitobacter koreense]MCR8825453.1 hypothetical protein [Pseudosulfitobacter koreense]
MGTQETVRFYLEAGLRDSAAAGGHNFIGKIAGVLEDAGLRCEFVHGTKAARLAGAASGHLSLSHMKPPVGPRGLTFRRVYHYPFWQIDQTDRRWDWDVARADFSPDQIDPKEAQRFYAFWQKRLFADAPARADNDGFVYMPLQGRLTKHRSFQSCAPLEMIHRTRAAWPDRRIVATLHPREVYTDAEITALKAIDDRDPLLEVRIGEMDRLLPACDCVVTQNSSAAFNGYFFGKPAILFAEVDFHHIALRGDDSASFRRVADHRPDYAKYIWWFWQDQSINAGHPTAEARIAARLARFGWPVT